MGNQVSRQPENLRETERERGMERQREKRKEKFCPHPKEGSFNQNGGMGEKGERIKYKSVVTKIVTRYKVWQ